MFLTRFVGTESLFKVIYLLLMPVTSVQLPFVASAKGLMAAGTEVHLCHKKRGVTERIVMNDMAALVPEVKKNRGEIICFLLLIIPFSLVVSFPP